MRRKKKNNIRREREKEIMFNDVFPGGRNYCDNEYENEDKMIYMITHTYRIYKLT